MTSIVASATDILLALLYAKGSTGKNNEPIAGTTKIEKFLFLIENESTLSDIVKKDYDFQADDYGPCAHEIFDDLEMLKDAGIIKEDVRPTYSALDESDKICEEESFSETDIENEVKTVKIYSLTPKGEKIGRILFEALDEKNKDKLVALKKIFNKKPANVIIKYVYERYPDMIVESKIKN